MDVNKLLEHLEYAQPDKVNTTRELSAYEQGWLHGRIDLIRYIRQLLEGEEE